MRAADDRAAIVSVLNGLVHSGYAKGTQLTVAIDTRTGAKLWEPADSRLVTVAGDVALVDDGRRRRQACRPLTQGPGIVHSEQARFLLMSNPSTLPE